MTSYLLITESPAKAKKIQGFLGSNYKVLSSCGHIRDLEKKKTQKYGDPNVFGIDFENNFKQKYVVMSEKRDVVKNLKSGLIDRKLSCGMMMIGKKLLLGIQQMF